MEGRGGKGDHSVCGLCVCHYGMPKAHRDVWFFVQVPGIEVGCQACMTLACICWVVSSARAGFLPVFFLVIISTLPTHRWLKPVF